MTHSHHGGPQPTTHFRRNRRALDFAFRCQGANTAVQSCVPFDPESTTLSVWRQPSSPPPSGSTRLASTSRASSTAHDGQSSPTRRMPIPTSSPAMRLTSCAVAFSSLVDGTQQSGQQGLSHQPATKATVRRQDLTSVSFVSLHLSSHGRAQRG